MYMILLGKPTDTDLNTFPPVLLTGPREWDPSVLDYTHPTTAGDPTLAPDPSQCGAHDPELMTLAILRGEFTTPSLIPLAIRTFLNTNMLSKLNLLILRN